MDIVSAKVFGPFFIFLGAFPTHPGTLLALLQSFWIGFRKRYKLRSEQKGKTLNGNMRSWLWYWISGRGSSVANTQFEGEGAWRSKFMPSHRKNQNVITKPMQRPVQGPPCFGICLKNAAHSLGPR